MTDPRLAEVLAHGGWRLLDPGPIAGDGIARQDPDTAEMPPPEERSALGRGWLVRALFELADLADPVRDGAEPYADGLPHLVLATERMWLVVLGRDGQTLDCMLDHKPYAAYTRLCPGARIALPTSHVIAIAPPREEGDLEAYLADLAALGLPLLDEAEHTRAEDPTRWPSVRDDQSEVCRGAGVWPHPPWPSSRLLVATDLTVKRTPLHGGRLTPAPDRGDNGWVVFAGYDSMDEVSAGPGFEVVSVQDAAARRPDLLPYLALPPGWGFTTGPAGDEVYPIDVEG